MDESTENTGKETVSPFVGVSNGLTGIPSRIHCPATQYEVEAGYDELDEIAIENFLDVLAEVALAVAARNINNEERNGD